MNILIIDQKDLQTTLRTDLLNKRNHTITVIDSFNALKEVYTPTAFDIVLIDFDMLDSEKCIGKNCLHYIETLFPKQRTITLSATNQYSDPHGCKHCVVHNNRKRLNKPTPINNIIRLIEYFDDYPCDHYHEDEVN